MNNSAAIGYMILAAKRLGLDVETIKQLDRMMYDMMDVKSEEEAEEGISEVVNLYLTLAKHTRSRRMKVWLARKRRDQLIRRWGK
ncbi:hypothetical protein OMP38_14650 [Cohnella ginsengisoli]|uniref:Uncharacterized protein n=1 Tax=Cohnella ginsengisoli TaxID=425004 RepID=A0A9X4KHM4_9BACL|nr:hypothetical protein [Cohnella ginsengisoli]MDG0791956.1 hypothetical protein [Cohnella ginsengisoli]